MVSEATAHSSAVAAVDVVAAAAVDAAWAAIELAVEHNGTGDTGMPVLVHHSKAVWRRMYTAGGQAELLCRKLQRGYSRRLE